MQAITTYYIGPAAVKGSRVKAIAYAGSVTLSWDDALNADENHAEAMIALCKKFNWSGEYVAGCAHNSKGAKTWVNVDRNYEKVTV